MYPPDPGSRTPELVSAARRSGSRLPCSGKSSLSIGGGRCKGGRWSRCGGRGRGRWSLVMVVLVVVGCGRCDDGSRCCGLGRFRRSPWSLVVVMVVGGGRNSGDCWNRGDGCWSLVVVVLIVVGGGREAKWAAL